MSAPPEQRVWDALEAHGCQPHGQSWKGSALCPAHEDRDPSLSIGVGADGRALLHCYAGCSAREITDALGLALADLFPPGHRQARRVPLATARRLRGPVKKLADTLAALDDIGRPWTAQVGISPCPYCGGRAWLTAHSTGAVGVDCGEDCGTGEFSGALAAAATEARKARRA